MLGKILHLYEGTKMNSLLQKEEKKVSPYLIMMLIIILNITVSILSFDMGRSDMKREACNSAEFKCNPEDYIIKEESNHGKFME